MTDKMIALPQRSEGGLAATDIFYRSYNEFYFYVEDADQENLYFVILKAIFPELIFEKIFPLGGKPSVLAHAKECGANSLQKRVYILDKDFDDLLNKKEDIKGLFYLDRFCIENFFLQEEAMVEIVVESDPKIGREEVRRNLRLEKTISEIGNDLRTLFSLFYFAQLEDLGIANCRLKPESFCKSKQLWEICPILMSKYLDDINAICDQRGIPKPAEPLSSDTRLLGFYRASESQIISGKFWLSMLFHYIKSKYRLGSVTFDSLTFRAAKNCNFEGLRWLVVDVLATYP
ncbi:DUF4435 domain-containing protein [Acidiphilium sp. PA]|uniref:DUF4435 domain-containing protein n=1 Tax=Acidiphilium sp. PA TaxID=2871705 RepID=UPI002244717F|nr:DUF4435 domain-containing protein [Acidiphilium sp. PA]MCW8308199.1 DUF4435 domain-containing protein [Acidiphilium sp. PA]